MFGGGTETETDPVLSLESGDELAVVGGVEMKSPITTTQTASSRIGKFTQVRLREVTVDARYELVCGVSCVGARW